MDGWRGAVKRSAYFGTPARDRIEGIAIDVRGRVSVAGIGISGEGQPVALYRRLDDPAQPSASVSAAVAELASKASGPYLAAFVNGGLEFGAPGNAPVGWTVSQYLNTKGFTLQSPQTLDTLNLTAGGAGLTTSRQRLLPCSTVTIGSMKSPSMADHGGSRGDDVGSRMRAVLGD